MQENHQQKLRQQLVSLRNRVSGNLREQYGQRAWRYLQRWPRLKHCQFIACYLPAGGEFPTRHLIQGLRLLGKDLFLPIVRKKSRRLSFQRYREQTAMRRNGFGIAEPIPDPVEQILPARLDLVIMPLTGFDKSKNRIGMGGGYYDRTFEFVCGNRRVTHPFLLGLGFQVQQCEKIDPRPWDVPLDGILTERGLDCK